MKKLVPFTLLVGLLALSLSSCMSEMLYRKAIARNDKSSIVATDTAQATRKARTAGKPSWISEQRYETVSIQSEDGLKLTGYWLPAAQPSARTVMLAHGYSGRAFQMSEFARFYHEELGYNVFMPDARGHGASEGDYIGMGWPERKDWLLWIDWVLKRSGRQGEIVLHGISMGGATVMMTSGESLPGQVKAVIEDCGYTSADDVFTHQLKQLYRLGREPLIPQTSKLTKERAGYSFEEASALEQVKKSVTPTLFIHGDADTFVPFEMVHRLYEACAAEKELFVVAGAKHGESFWNDREGYKATVKAFLARYMSI